MTALSFRGTTAMSSKVPQDEVKRNTSGSVRVGPARDRSPLTHSGPSANTQTAGIWVKCLAQVLAYTNYSPNDNYCYYSHPALNIPTRHPGFPCSSVSDTGKAYVKRLFMTSVVVCATANPWFQPSTGKADHPRQVQAREQTLLAATQLSREAWLKNVAFGQTLRRTCHPPMCLEDRHAL